MRSANAQMLREALVSRKNLTVLFLVCALALMQAAQAQVEMVVIQLGFTALRMGATLVGQMRNREGINYDAIKRKNKLVDPVHEAWGYNKPTAAAEHKDSPHGQQVKEDAAATEKNSEDNAVKSVHGTVVEHSTKEIAVKEEAAKEDTAKVEATKVASKVEPAKEEAVKEEQSEKNAGSKKKEPSSAPYLMMNVSE
jgi:hypothetical protein